MIVIIEPEKCTACGKCFRICPVEAVQCESENKFRIEPSICINCLACERECPAGAIRWVEGNMMQEAGKENEFSDVNENKDTKKCLQSRGKTIRLLRFVVEECMAPVVETLFLLFMKGAERFFRNSCRECEHEHRKKHR